ncbi:hypothetical protein QYM36_015504 [Artemia franciscana]|uniref:Endoplasmic reticulum lectin 1 n=1 Tax=Artemia franciscana TaxID=6661 RepID=A0AA88KZH7_ARTSF|nr:hypothetical protein QYM36_015504 [Artemia franciscana]
MHRYFPYDIDTQQWICNPFSIEMEEINFLNLKAQEEFAELTSETTLRLRFSQVPVHEFWIEIKSEYPLLSEMAMNKLLPFCTTYLFVCFYDLKEFYPFDDTRLYKLTWEKPDIEPLAEVVENTQDGGETVSDANPYEGLESLKMKTANGEEYLCYLPNETEEKKDEMLEYTGPNPIQLMMPLMSLLTCSYKIESYWTYELCHGRHLRQYHEERDAKKQKLQEYFLGYYDKDKLEALDKQFEENPLKAKDVPLRKIDSLTLPYLEIKMDGGTVCDLSGKPRSTKVIYVCHPPGKHEIYSIEEVSTCEYEVVVLTPSLCKHPLYKPVESSEKKITCTPIGENPKRPVALMELESESLLLRHQNILVSFISGFVYSHICYFEGLTFNVSG